MTIFNSYVKLPEGNTVELCIVSRLENRCLVNTAGLRLLLLGATAHREKDDENNMII